MAQIKNISNDKLYDSRNYYLIGLGIAIIIIGYVCLGWKPEDGILTMNVAPVLLVLGYCVILPMALFLRPAKESVVEKQPIQGKK